LQIDIMGEYFSRAANDLNDVKESINQKLKTDANASLQRVTTSSRQLGFTSLVRGAEELSSVIQLQPNNSMTTQSLLFFLRCELQMIQTEWDFVLSRDAARESFTHPEIEHASLR
jgi:hypothetical protein